MATSTDSRGRPNSARAGRARWKQHTWSSRRVILHRLQPASREPVSTAISARLEILDVPHGARFVGEMDRVSDTYGELLPRMQAWVAERFPQQSGDKRLRVPAGDAGPVPGRGPRASPGRIPLEHRDLRHRAVLRAAAAPHARYPLPEARRYADKDAARAAQGDPVLPPTRRRARTRRRVVDLPRRRPGGCTVRVVSRLWPDLGQPESSDGAPFEVTLLDFDPDGEEKVLVAACFSHTRLLRARGGPPCPGCSGTRTGSRSWRPKMWAIGATAAIVPVAPSSGPTTASSSSPTTARSATCSATGC